MIYSKGHGRNAFGGDCSQDKMAQLKSTFRFYDKSLPQPTHRQDIIDLLRDLGRAMTNPALFPENKDSKLPAVFTYFGQFIDHDISAGTDFDPGIARSSMMMFARQSEVTDDQLVPMDRKAVEDGIINQNTAKLDLDSLYGDVLIETEFDEILARALRHTDERFAGKMRIAFPSFRDAPDAIKVPRDGAGDLLRLNQLIEDGTLAREELEALPDEFREIFFEMNGGGSLGDLNLSRAIIGDARNDENLFVAQFHLAMLRLHNRVVDSCRDQAVIDGGDQALFEWAQKHVRWIYQWLVVNVYLKSICDAEVFDTVVANNAAVYHHFLQSTGGDVDGRLPLPLEFSTSAFRFGHSMARDAYDWNDVFTFPNGALSLLFRFTGGANGKILDNDNPNIPSNWIADWQRLAIGGTDQEGTFTKAIDTNLSATLRNLPFKQGENGEEPERNLATLNLFKGHLLNMPSAQSLIAYFNRQFGLNLPTLSEEALSSGPTGTAIEGTILATETPLWFYILREAELAGGDTLGKLGSLIVASTLLGLIVEDDATYWHQPGSDNGRWHPDDAKVNGISVTDIPQMMRAALVLE